MPQNRRFLRSATWAASAFLLIAAAGSCKNNADAEGGADTAAATASASPSVESPSASVTSLASPSAGSTPSTCTGGWKVPRRGTELWTFPLELIHQMSHHGGAFKVVAMRYFVGGESPPDPDKPYLQDIERWYVKLYDPRDRSFRGRFLVERRPFGSSVVAVAPFDTKGFVSPDWQGLTHEAADTRPKRYPGLPGTWSGVTYDFVEGGAGINLPGLPVDLAGCLDGS